MKIIAKINELSEDVELDLFPGTTIAFSYQFSDVFKLNTRKVSRSFTIDLPDTRKNNRFFGNIFNLSQTSTNFDQNKKAPVEAIDGGNTLLRGVLKLVRIKPQGTGRIYQIQLFGELKNIFSDIEEKSIRELELGSHLFTSTIIRDSWFDNGDTASFFYPWIDYGQANTFIRVNDTTYSNFSISHARPASFIKPLIKKILQGVGYTLAGTFYNNPEIRDQYMPFTEGEFEITDIESEKFDSIFRVSQGREIRLAGTVKDLGVPFTDVEFNPGLNFNPPEYIVPRTGQYTMVVVITLLAIGKTSNIDTTIRDFRLKLVRDGDEVIDQTILDAITSQQGAQQVTLSSTQLYTVGERITVRASVGKLSDNGKLFVQDGTWRGQMDQPTDLTIQSGNTVDMSNFVPDIKQIELIRSQIEKYNLLVIEDIVNKTIELAPRDKVLKDINVVHEDWTEKEDKIKVGSTVQVSEKYNRVLKFRYKHDSRDLLIEQFNEDESVYAEHEEILDNEFLSGEQTVVNSVFAPTVDAYRYTGLLILPTIINKDDRLDENGAFKPTFRFMPRILIYDGLRDSSPVVIDGESVATGANIKTKFTFDQYPYSYFIKDDGSSSLSYSSGVAFDRNDKGLVEKYYRSELDQINSGKVVTKYIRLTNKDIQDLDFTVPKRIGSDYFYLNRIPEKKNTEESTRVELITI